MPLPQFKLDAEAQLTIAAAGFFWVWLTLFVFAATQYVFAHMVADWYYGQDGATVGLCHDMLKNAGSLAFGSLLCTVLLLIKWAVEVAVAYNQRFSQSDNVMAKCALRCAVCCVQAFQRCVRFISDQAYIVMAAGGNGFVDSVEEAMGLVASKPLLFTVCEFSTWLVSSFVKVLIVALSALVAYLVTTKDSAISGSLFQTWFPLLLYVLASYPCAAAMMSFFGYSANSLLLFFLKDRQRLVSGQKCPQSLREFIDLYN